MKIIFKSFTPSPFAIIRQLPKYVISVLLIVSSVACTKNASPGSQQAAGGSGANPSNVDGTYSGGGGNGINGTAIESFHQDIASLPEFQMYIAPILERMAQSSPDIFVGYLNWAIHHKSWYFVPVALPNLPKEKTALAFPSDQLALHSESEIYIDQNAYLKKSRKERASLLMHELVMGARLLMKHSAKFQCAALSTDQQATACDSEALLKLAVSPPGSEDDKPSLTGIDDEAVRSMTVFLLSRNQDYSGPTVRAFRLGLGFNYPWDRMVSTLTLDSLQEAFVRSEQTDDPLFSMLGQREQPDASKIKTKCEFFHDRRDRFSSFALSYKFVDGINDSQNDLSELRTEDRYSHAEGVLDPRGGNNVVDHIYAGPNPTSYDFKSPTRQTYSYDFYISREEHPRLIKVEVRKVVIIAKQSGANEVAPVRGSPVTTCAVED